MFLCCYYFLSTNTWCAISYIFKYCQPRDKFKLIVCRNTKRSFLKEMWKLQRRPTSIIIFNLRWTIERTNRNVERLRDSIHTGTEYVIITELVNVRPSKFVYWCGTKIHVNNNILTHSRHSFAVWICLKFLFSGHTVARRMLREHWWWIQF